MKDWYVYIIETFNNKLYTGIALDPKERFGKHQSGKGAKFFRISPPKRIVYIEKVGEKSLALKREIAIKKMPRAKKQDLFNN